MSSAFSSQHMNSLVPNEDARRREDEARRETKNRCSLDRPCLPTLVQRTCSRPSLFWPSLLSVVLEALRFYRPVAA